MCIFGGIPNYVAYRNRSLCTTFAEYGFHVIRHLPLLGAALRSHPDQRHRQKVRGARDAASKRRSTHRSSARPAARREITPLVRQVDEQERRRGHRLRAAPGTFVNPEARYSAYHKDEADVRAGRLLMKWRLLLQASARGASLHGNVGRPLRQDRHLDDRNRQEGGRPAQAIGKALGQALPSLGPRSRGGGALKLVKSGPAAALYTAEAAAKWRGRQGREASGTSISSRARAARAHHVGEAPIQVKRGSTPGPGQSTDAELRIRVPAPGPAATATLRVALDTSKQLKITRRAEQRDLRTAAEAAGALGRLRFVHGARVRSCTAPWRRT